MPRVCNEIQFASFEPDAVQMLADIFDDVWSGVAPDFGAEPNTIEMGRIRLATIILELARDGQLGPDQITRTAGRLIREALQRNERSAKVADLLKRREIYLFGSSDAQRYALSVDMTGRNVPADYGAWLLLGELPIDGLPIDLHAALDHLTEHGFSILRVKET